MYFQSIKNELQEYIQKTFPEVGFSDSFHLSKPPDSKLGHLAYGCFPLAKTLKKNPSQIAEILVAEQKNTSFQWIDILKNEGAYLNIFLNFQKLGLALLTEIHKNPDYTRNKLGNGEKVMIEFSSPNTNKPMHLGHARNNAIGFSLAKIFEQSSYEVIKANLINDRGIHICQSMLAYHLWGEASEPKTKNKKGDHFVGDFYTLFHKKSKEDASLQEKTQTWLQKWEQGDKEILTLWQKMKDWVMEGFQETYRRCGVNFDRLYFESETYQKGKEEVQKALQKKLAFKDPDGNTVIDLEKEKLGIKVLLRADGTGVYITQDIGTTIQKFKDYAKLKKCFFVVGNEQLFHLKTLFAVLKKFGYDWADSCQHISYGMIHLPEGKMKSREGKVVDLDNLIDEVAELALTELKKRKHFNRKQEELEEVAEKVALAAIKYFILRTTIHKDFVFDKKQSLSFEGDTGPYLQYSYARICSLLKKASFSAEKNFFTKPTEWNEEEIQILISLLTFPKTIEKACLELNPSIIAATAYDICRQFNKFYYEHSVLDDEKNKEKRLALVFCTQKILRITLEILGIFPLEQM